MPRAIPAGHDYPLSTRFDETDSLVVFDDVFVPWEHVFVYRNIELTAAQFQRMAAHSLGNTQAQIRFAVKLRFFAGLARLMADGSGVHQRSEDEATSGADRGKCSVPEAFVLAAENGATADEFGVFRPDPAMLYTAMTLQPTLMNEVNYQLRELAGGSVIQLPSSYASFGDPTTAADIDRYIRWPDVAAGERVALLKLVWDAIGSEFAGRHQQYEMFYAGEAGVVQMRAFGGYDGIGRPSSSIAASHDARRSSSREPKGSHDGVQGERVRQARVRVLRPRR